MYIKLNELINALYQAGINKGDTVIVHSDIAAFGTTENFSKKDALEVFYNAFMEVLGNDGTLCVPAYFYEYARFGIPFDIALSPVSKELGVFSKFINSLPERKRSCNPLTSVCAVGKNADYICEWVNRHAYGTDSAFDRLYKLNAKTVLMGVTLNSFTFGHFVEYKIGLPFLYNKIYELPIYNNGELVFENSFSSVRYLEYDIEYKQHTQESWQILLNELITLKYMKKYEYLNSTIYSAYLQDIFEYMAQLLYKNPYVNLTHKPFFPKGKVPNDGPAIKK